MLLITEHGTKGICYLEHYKLVPTTRGFLFFFFLNHKKLIKVSTLKWIVSYLCFFVFVLIGKFLSPLGLEPEPPTNPSRPFTT